MLGVAGLLLTWMLAEGQSLTPRPISVEVNGFRNTSGHWISQVVLEHVDTSAERDRWRVGVQHESAILAGGDETVSRVILTFTGARSRPGPYYDLLPGLGYYMLHTIGTNWASARQICLNEGGHLLVINSEREVAIARTLFQKYPNITNTETKGWAWVGVYEGNENGKYFTVFDKPASVETTGFMTWLHGLPDNKEPGNCILLHIAEGAYKDYICERNFVFICEQSSD